MSPFLSKARGPPTAASGETWQTPNPRAKPEKRPSVTTANFPSSPMPTTVARTA